MGALAILNLLSSPAGQAAIGGTVKLVTILLHKDGGATVLQFLNEGDAALDQAMKEAADWKRSHPGV